jgi:subtilase family serine protease
VSRTVVARCLMAFAAAVAVVVVPTVAQAGPPGMPPGLADKDVCAPPVPGVARCHAKVVTQAKTGEPYATQSYSTGLRPVDLHSAYNLAPLPDSGSAFSGNGQTVAIVDAYDNPNAAADLLAYRQQFGLPLCTTDSAASVADATSCFFTKVNQDGLATPLPTGNTSWGQEIDLDIEMASATCPACKILLVEAKSNSFADLGAAVDTAARFAGAGGSSTTAISNSYGGSEFSGETGTAYNGHFDHPGIAITVSSGDSGYGTQFPASSDHVTAVGGTHLAKSSTTRGWTETAWSGAGSGCSAYIARPSWQTKVGSCNNRIVADVSAVADPNTGVAVYDSYGSTGGANWYVFGGTSVASPIIASVYALAGNAGGAANPTQYPYANPSKLFDVTSGSNGKCVTGKRNTADAPLCTAGAGYDGPTGLGTPNGTDSF